MCLFKGLARSKTTSFMRLISIVYLACAFRYFLLRKSYHNHYMDMAFPPYVGSYVLQDHL